MNDGSRSSKNCDNATINLKGSSHGISADSMDCLIYFVLHIVVALVALLASCCGAIGSGSARHAAAWHCATVLAVALYVVPRHFTSCLPAMALLFVLWCCTLWCSFFVAPNRKMGKTLCGGNNLLFCWWGWHPFVLHRAAPPVAAAVVYFAPEAKKEKLSTWQICRRVGDGDVHGRVFALEAKQEEILCRCEVL